MRGHLVYLHVVEFEPLAGSVVFDEAVVVTLVERATVDQDGVQAVLVSLRLLNTLLGGLAG